MKGITAYSSVYFRNVELGAITESTLADFTYADKIYVFKL